MRRTTIEHTAVVTPQIYSRILSSKRLQPKLLPQGILTSPYEVLDYDATLTLQDALGMRATFRRRQNIRFLQDGVSAILDHAWGDGVTITSYHNDAGRLADSFLDEGCRHLVIDLQRVMARGDTLDFTVERSAFAGFTNDQEWLDTTIDHPIKRLRRNIVFPSDRPCLGAVLTAGDMTLRLPVSRRVGGQTRVSFEIPEAEAYTSYIVRWEW